MEKKYRINEHNAYLYFYLMLIILLPTKVNGSIHPVLFSFKLISSVLLIIIICLRFYIKIFQSHISYEIKFLGITVRKKDIFAKRLKKLTFKRVGWKQKCTVVHVNKGINFRVLSKNIGVHSDFYHFGKKNNVLLEKTKDYTILERVGK